MPTCTMLCHSAANAMFFGGLVLEGDFVPNLVDKPATNKGVANMATCTPGAKLIDSAMPENSVMLKKILGTQSCGDAMPQGGTLTQAQRDCLKQWIMTF